MHSVKYDGSAEDGDYALALEIDKTENQVTMITQYGRHAWPAERSGRSITWRVVPDNAEQRSVLTLTLSGKDDVAALRGSDQFVAGSLKGTRAASRGTFRKIQ